jgi:hypothetical protein
MSSNKQYLYVFEEHRDDGTGYICQALGRQAMMHAAKRCKAGHFPQNHTRKALLLPCGVLTGCCAARQQ